MSNASERDEDLLLTRRGMEALVVDSGGVSRGSHVVLEDLDDATRAEFVLVASPESDPEHGRLSDESPVDAHAPHRVRHPRIAEVRRI